MVTIPADTQLYHAATDYVHNVARSHRFILPDSDEMERNIQSALNSLLQDSQARLETELARHHIEYHDNQDILDIALQICNVDLNDI